MIPHRVLAIGLDGLEVTLAERLMAEGQMPALAALKKRAARFLLATDRSQRTGIPWESVASGLSPEAGQRWGSLQFDPSSYTTWQEGANFAPWWTETDLKVVVFDPPYLDLRRALNTQGITAWGAHNPGAGAMARPETLWVEFEQRFGRYPATEWTYANPWPSAARTQRMGEALVHALQVRSRAAKWLAAERFPEWDFFFTVASELHGGMEGLWHGLDASHPLHTHPSAEPAGRALVSIHRALDNMVGQLIDAAGDAAIIAFNTGGMGPNHCDIQSMVLVAELLYRHAFGEELLTLPTAWTAAPQCLPILDENDTWEAAAQSWIPAAPMEDGPAGPMHALARHLPQPFKKLVNDVRSAADRWHSRHAPPKRPESELDWMPGNRYRRYWPKMPAFALPSFSDGRIRINLRGRERQGIVDLKDYEQTCQSLETLLRECRDPRTGEPAVATIERPFPTNPLALGTSQADLRVVWRNTAAAIEHPRLGLIGPVPLHKTGHHTGEHGIAYLAAPGIAPGERGVHSAFDIAPTIVHLLGAAPPIRLTGKSLLYNPVRVGSSRKVSVLD